MRSSVSPARIVIGRGLRGRCPQCGRAPLFATWFGFLPACSECGLDFLRYQDELWGVLYVTTAFLTGVVIIGMLMITPANAWLGRLVVVAAALGLWLGTYRLRKGLALALFYLSDLLWNNHGRYRLR